MAVTRARRANFTVRERKGDGRGNEDEREESLLPHGNRREMDEKGRAHNSAGRPLPPRAESSLADGFFCSDGEVYIGTPVLNPRAN